jgi:hypothetical protein
LFGQIPGRVIPARLDWRQQEDAADNLVDPP